MNESFDELNHLLFGLPYNYEDKNNYDHHDWVIKTYFDRMYNDHRFLDVVDHIVHKIGYSTDGAYCHFACEYDGFLDDMIFKEGFFFAIGYPPEKEDEIVVSEETCFHYVRLACEKYLKVHSEDLASVSTLLSKMQMS
ncbi:ribonuclease toxin immunity protein CdiI [Providencia rettgeri]|uniref:ribonuclease toxin immunity protein CdiI n=1 Tax=Providencia rettgeri TaxID=587 RepID=UPI0018C501D1|nr:ribonuclease toxin immunity protein CdiI [Providencia rettgeri]MBG5928983.1 ribonuclease toxin immunity protein CdiI [Providencia rettgeri]